MDGVEVGRFRKSSHSVNDGPDCVELAPVDGGGVAVRDSKLGELSPVLFVSASERGLLMEAVRSGSWG